MLFFWDLDDLVIGPPTGPIGASTGPDAIANFTATQTRSTSTGLDGLYRVSRRRSCTYLYVPRRHTLSAESIQFKTDLTVRFICENSRCLTQSLPSAPRSFHQLAPSQRVQMCNRLFPVSCLDLAMDAVLQRSASSVVSKW